jgi:hypothetical protein
MEVLCALTLVLSGFSFFSFCGGIMPHPPLQLAPRRSAQCTPARTPPQLCGYRNGSHEPFVFFLPKTKTF